jgi:CheY-like chemotaxis protein
MSISVLVARDNHDAADSLALFLRVLGYQAAVTYNARQALAAALATPPDYLLADDLALARAARKHAALDATVLVAVTEHAHPARRSQALAAGYQHCVTLDELPTVLLPSWLTRAGG